MKAIELKAGTIIQLGEKYCEKYNIHPDETVIVLINGFFENDNGLYVETIESPAIWNGEEYESIYHLFGNNMENWLDCRVVSKGEIKELTKLREGLIKIDKEANDILMSVEDRESEEWISASNIRGEIEELLTK